MKPPLYVSLKPFLDHHVLPRPTDWQGIFNNERPLEVEIGCGNGEYLARLAQENPKTNYVGFEEYCERISRTMRKLSRVKPGDNARVLRLDVRPGLAYLFPARSISFIHCLFPPPWPKKSDIKHRLFTTDFLRLANNRLVDGGALKVVTDHKPYADWLEEQVEGSGFALARKLVPAGYDTKFERKWVEGGQKQFHELVLAKNKHTEVPHKEDAPLNHYTISDFEPGAFQMEEFSGDGMAAVLKDFLYDPKREIAQATVLVHDEYLLQNIRIVVIKTEKGWHIHLAQGSMLMPTPGVAKALELVRDAALRTTVDA